MTVTKESAECRHCGKVLTGEPYHKSYHAFLDNGDRAPVNLYGGFVCSRECDVAACLRVSGSMPGHGASKRLDSYEGKAVRDNWGE